MKLTVILPTYNPRSEFLERTLAALQSQTLDFGLWSLLVIDNASPAPLSPGLVEWHPNGRLVREEQLGLTHARLRGILEADGELLVWVDDDNVLDPNYLTLSREAFTKKPHLGAAGGRSLADYLEPPPAWYRPGIAPLGCRDLGEEEIRVKWDSTAPTYPHAAPIGAGMVTRKRAIQTWVDAIRNDPTRLALGRTGTALTSGEDNDMNLTLLRAGWDLAYLPDLRLRHLIPPGRLTLDYQKRIARVSFRDFVRVLDIHGIRPWPAIPAWSVPLRAFKAWFTEKAWSDPAAAVRWQGVVGQYEGRAKLRSR